MKRIISFLLVICITMGAFALCASAAYDESAYSKTGDQAADIVGIALTQVGYHESGDNNTKYGAWAGNNYVGWCDIFISWCAAKAGVSSSVIPQKSFGGADSGMNWFIKKGQFKYRESGYTPKPGDIMFLDWNYNGSPDHVGIVVEAYSDGSVRIIDGNYSDQVNNRLIYPGSGMKWNNIKSVVGYGTPAYSKTGSSAGSTGNNAASETKCDSYYKVSTNDSGLILRSAPVSGNFLAEMPKGTMLRVTKTTVSNGNAWGYTTYNGKSGWCHLGYTALIAHAKDIKLTVTADVQTVEVGEQLQLNGKIQPDTLAALGDKWTSSDPSVMSVDAKGVVTAKAAGKAVVTYTSAANLGTPASFELEAVVVDGYYYVKANGKELPLREQASETANAIAQIPDETLIHITDTKQVDGTLWGYAAYNGNNGWCALQYTELFALTDDISITVMPVIMDMILGGEADFTGKILPEQLGKKGGSWTSSDETVVRVDENGHAVAVGIGKAVLTYTSNLGLGEPATAVITVHGETSMPGDVDFDGMLSVGDIMTMRNVIMSEATFSEEVLAIYDLNGDEKINVSDIMVLKGMIMAQ